MYTNKRLESPSTITQFVYIWSSISSYWEGGYIQSVLSKLDAVLQLFVSELSADLLLFAFSSIH